MITRIPAPVYRAAIAGRKKRSNLHIPEIASSFLYTPMQRPGMPTVQENWYFITRMP
jgi:hypothetical protein